MKNPLLLLLACAACAGLGWFGGSRTAGPAGASDALPDEDVAALEAENERLRAELRERGPGLVAAGPGAPGADARETPAAAGGGTAAAGARTMPKRFSLAGITEPDVAVKAFQSYALEMWRHGKQGHLRLVEALSDLVRDKDAMKRLFASEEQAVRYLYPMVKFLVQNEQDVARTTETVIETMANEPQRFAEVDDDALEVFTEGAGIFLPAIVDEKRMQALRQHARKILDTPQDRQPESVRRNRRRVGRLLRFWQPPLSPEEALAKIQAGEVTPEEVRGLLGRLGPEQLRQVDLPRFLGPSIAKGDYRAMGALAALPLDARTRDGLDQHFLRGAREGTVQQWTVGYYLRSTKRTKWEDARALFEAGFEQGGRSATVFAGGLLQVPERPDKAWVAWALDRYEMPEAQARTLKQAFGIE